jgi:hypothetical protein
MSATSWQSRSALGCELSPHPMKLRSLFQLDLFPSSREVAAVDPKSAIGPRTSVSQVYRVRYDGERAVHQVLVDKYGWYCADHGPLCPAVQDARDAEARRAEGRAD